MASFAPLDDNLQPLRKGQQPKPVSIGGRQFGISAFSNADYIDDGIEAEVKVRWEGGRYVCKAVTVRNTRGGAVTADALRAVSIDDLVRTGVTIMHLDYGERLDIRKPDVSEGPTDNNLMVVAEIYRHHLALGNNPTQKVQELLGLTKPTAGRWVMKARDKGYLGPTTERRAGA